MDMSWWQWTLWCLGVWADLTALVTVALLTIGRGRVARGRDGSLWLAYWRPGTLRPARAVAHTGRRQRRS